ncbi:hypothetical protein HELRODRAFT_167946 [Helobdella robusta]|uniref:Uncharacterized protein n=1 Tax=Helobdella robusta TaxID=6412 RepID=T1EZZ9_HELRO|nr:hypothetical protein HELRODRAFT_167946 [Helobdella robusta]ESO10094.1 hypothetical protein HELRODRAFT_167946 [Helobdella robusta]
MRKEERTGEMARCYGKQMLSSNFFKRLLPSSFRLLHYNANINICAASDKFLASTAPYRLVLSCLVWQIVNIIQQPLSARVFLINKLTEFSPQQGTQTSVSYNESLIFIIDWFISYYLKF